MRNKPARVELCTAMSTGFILEVEFFRGPA